MKERETQKHKRVREKRNRKTERERQIPIIECCKSREKEGRHFGESSTRNHRASYQHMDCVSGYIYIYECEQRYVYGSTLNMLVCVCV